MNPVAAKYGAPLLASVNLVPKDIQERRKMRAVRTLAIVVVLIAIGAVAVGYIAALGAHALAQSNLNDKVAQQTEALNKRDSYAGVHTAYATRETQEFALTQIGWGEVDMSSFIAAIASQADGKDASFVSITVLGPNAMGPGSGVQDLLFGASVGTVHFSATTSSSAQASSLLARLEATPGLAAVRGNAERIATIKDGVYWTVEGTALITPNALTGRLFPEESVVGLVPDSVLDTLLRDPNAEPSPEPSASPSPEATEGEG